MMLIYRSPRLQAVRDYIMGRWLPPVLAFIRTQQLSSILLLLATIAALIWVNSPWDESYFDFWETEVTVDVGLFSIQEHLKEWVNIGLMTIFFFVVAMEIKRELVHGELSTRRKAVLPVLAALGGMIVPATVFLIFNPTGDGARGWGIPMATDIAFALGVLALLARSLPSELRVFLLAVAVADDIGAILVIAVFYTEGLDLGALGWAFVMFGIIFTASRVFGIRSIPLYWILGLFFWVAVFKSGVHATIAGVALGMLVPANPLYPRQAFRP